MPRNTVTQNQQNTEERTGQQLSFQASITEYHPESGVLAYAQVKVGDVMTIRNVRIREDDYGLTVTMPKTKTPRMEQYKDSVFFADKSMKEAFDQAVKKTYQDSVLEPVLEDDEQEEEPEEEEEASGMQMEL